MALAQRAGMGRFTVLAVRLSVVAAMASGCTSSRPVGRPVPAPPSASDATTGHNVATATLSVGGATGVTVGDRPVALSLETSLLDSPAVSGADPSLVALVRALRPAFLRVGASSGDETTPSVAGLDRLAALAAATGVPVVLGLPLASYAPIDSAGLVASAQRRLGRLLIAVEIGNEPDTYIARRFRRAGWSYPDYRRQVMAYLSALRATAPHLPVWGPDTSTSSWLAEVAGQRPSPLAVLTAHYYPLSACNGHQPTVGQLLSLLTARAERTAAQGFLEAAGRLGVPAVIGEGNSVACGGEATVSDRAAAAFWAADEALLMSTAGVTATAFHVGMSGCTGYNPFCLNATGRAARHTGSTAPWRATPEYAGMQVGSLLAGGHVLDATLAAPGHDVRAYAARMPDGTRRVLLFNLDPPATAPLTVPHSSLLRGARSAAVTTVLASTDYSQARLTQGHASAGTTAAAIVNSVIQPGQALTLRPGTIVQLTLH